MKTYLLKAILLGTFVIFCTSSVGASNWDHTTVNQEKGQGSDGTYWATIKGGYTSNQAKFDYPYAECAIGSHQSPIALNLTSNPIPLTINPRTAAEDDNPQCEDERDADRLIVHYPRSVSSTEGSAISKDEGNAYVFRNTGHAVQVSFSKGYPGKLLIGRDVYPLVQFHFHTPSEHIIVKGQYPAGYSYGAELHFVHQRQDGKLAVLGVFLDDSHGSEAENPILKKIIEHTLREHDTYNKTGAGLSLDPSKLIPMDNGHVFTYAGSLTTPPCSEGVSWYVLSEPLKVAPAQIRQLQEFFPSNSRIVQNTNSRTVEIHKEPHVNQDHDLHFDGRRH